MDKIIVCTYDEKLLPIKMTSWAVCLDMFIENDFEIGPGEVIKVTSWIKTYLPIWWHVKIFARSWLATKMWLILANSVAVIDSDFRGNYVVQFFNYTKEKLSFKKYSRLTQMEFLPYYIWSWIYWTKEIPEIEFIVDIKLYNNFEIKYLSDRWKWWIWSTDY